jgi:hypothetical protein
MKKIKNLSFILSTMLLALSAVTFTACDDSNAPSKGNDENILTGTISEDITLVASKKYTLKGNVFIASGATITIEPGTVIFGDKVTKGALIIERGATINAAGTEAEPIVFTSSAPANYRNYGDWGGLVLLGAAANNQNANQPIEGITAGANGQYGGATDNDNSGTLTYVRIEFAGIALSTDNELNGLTMGSVGSGTTINHIQVSYSGDDSFEWFGGTVNAQYLVAYRGWDDDFDTDFGYRGNVQYAVSFRDPNIADKSGSNGFESDNDAAGSALTPKTAPKFSNVSWFGPHSASALASGAMKNTNASNNFTFGGHLRRNSDIQIYNSVFVGSQLNGVHFDKTGSAAIFKGNYFARNGVNISTSALDKLVKVTTGNAYDTTGFKANNFFESSQTTVDISAKISGFSTVLDINNPSVTLNAASSLLTGAKTVPAGLTQTVYVGAFDSTNNWLSGWTNFDPINTVY